MHLRKLFAAIAMSLALAVGTAAQSVPDAGGTTTPAPKKGSQKNATPRSKRKTRKQKGAPAPLKSVVEEETRKAPESTSPPSVTAPAAKPPAGEAAAAAAPVDHDPPVLTHTPVTAATQGKPLTITAHAEDRSGVFGPVLYLRKKGLPATEYIPMWMTAALSGVPGDYSLEIPAALVGVDALEYYLEAWDSAGNGPVRAGSAQSPFPITVEDEKRVVVKQEEPAPPTTFTIKPTGAPLAITQTEVTKVRLTEIHARRVGETGVQGAPEVGIAPAPAMAKANAPAESPGRNTLIGIGLDAGAPGGGGLTLLVRPLWWLHLNGGVAYNYAGFGYRGGVSLSPCWCAVTPTLNLDAGHYLSGNLNKFVTVTDPFEKNLLSDTTYTFATAQIGLEFGSQRWFNFYLRGGLAYVQHTFSGKDLTALAQNKITNDPSTVYQVGDGKVTAVLPCVSLGFNIFVY